ncbi:peptidoglycan-associated lipoprotein Pal [Glaesserella parasuis]|uniref:Peptidoglycan-associated lipoprotein n=3 Tax=Glaesserella parasuis TaxID=738 RepID=B8F377_GLAP5|nr:peptidoglycan-associated lipoprotein Pal [Glaesserella parasuis]EQA14830.1 peptidoglycan-associated lipoprotein [Glaesserella parasuis H465]ACL31779.1 18K peptidoglycan-associated outer membrane lipoprotein, precursor PalA [Glaesserella parasuis SH0165]AIK17317.1 peptidoglycan-associated outer membrane lipoprotein [Glaesserella parasuis]AIK89822.1 peptidoglycan-associated outer membrane lipoprotein [Glaesserella parasuis]ATW45836.1 peptidoglycan-associated lipoprotein [Glaesserella parasuis
MKKLAKVLMIAAPAFVLAACSSSNDNASANASANAGQTFGGMSVQDLQTRYNTVYFDFDSYTLKAEDQQLLDAHAQYLVASKGKVTVAGHADERGTPEYNIALGQRRADAVKDFLATKGASNVATVSYGEEKPAVLGHSEADYSKNRRAVLEY